MRFVPVALAMMISALGARAEPDIHMGPTERPEGTAILLASSRTSMLVGTADHVPGWRSSYFHPSEFASKGNGEVRIETRLLVALNRARRDVGHPIRIASGYRDRRHNRAVGGAPDSQHLHGTAVDLDLRGLGSYDRYRLMWFLIRHGFTSFGSYSSKPNLLHADMRRRAVTWHHGSGRHPAWFLRALKDTRWKRGSGGYWTRN